MNIRPEELDHIMQEFTNKNFYADMAKFFITQDITYEDLFKYATLDNSQFYNAVFTYIGAELINEANSGRYTAAIWRTVPKMFWTTYREDNNFPFEDYYTSALIKSLFKHFIKNDQDIYILTTIDAMLNEPDIDSSAIVDLILSDPTFHTSSIITHLMRQNQFTVADMLKLIVAEYNKSKNPDTLMNLMDEYAISKDFYIPLLSELKHYFLILKEDHTDYIELNVKASDTKKTNTALELIRQSLRAVILQDANLDIKQFLDSSMITHSANGDAVRTSIYKQVLDWVNDNPENMESLLFYGVEDAELLLDDRDYLLIAMDFLTAEYVKEVEYMSPYEAFIRIYNINRFKFLQHQQMYTLRNDMMSYLENFSLVASLALDEDIKWLLNFNN